MGSMWKVLRKKRPRSLTPSGKAGLEFRGQRELSLSYRVPAQEQASENVIEVEMLFFFFFPPLCLFTCAVMVERPNSPRTNFHLAAQKSHLL